MALLPLVFHALQLCSRGKAASVAAVTYHGELLIVSVALGAAAIGELIGSSARFTSPKIFAAGFCLLTLLLSAFHYADITACCIAAQPLEASVVANISTTSYVSTVICSACCIILAEAN